MAQTITRKADLNLLDQLTREIIAYRGQAGRALYEMGCRLQRVRQHELWRGRYGGFVEYLEQAAGLSRTTAYRLIRIAEHFNGAIAERYGHNKLDAALGYLEATQATEAAGDLLSAEIVIRADDGQFRAIALHQATEAQIREATALLQRSHRLTGVPRALRNSISRLEAKLPAAPPGTARGQRIRLSRGRDGRMALSLQGIPLDQLAEVAALLQAEAH